MYSMIRRRIKGAYPESKTLASSAVVLSSKGKQTLHTDSHLVQISYTLVHTEKMHHISEPPPKALTINIGYYFSYRQTNFTFHGTAFRIVLDPINVYGTARKHNVKPNQIWAYRNAEKINRKNDQNQKARSVHQGVSAHYRHFEKLVYTWFLNQCKV